MGGYLLLRLHPLLAATAWAAPTAAWTGAATALVLGAVAVGQSDLKQLLAASTCAQLGFVFVGAGSGAVGGGAAHLIGHAAVKSLLFLGAGAWLSTLGTRDVAALRGAGRRYRLVGATFAVGAVALAGVPPLALWASKDEIFAAAHASSRPLYLVCLAAAALSAVYSGKALGLVLRPLPDDPAAGYDTAESGHRRIGGWRQAPLVLLAGGAAGLEVLAVPPMGDIFRRLLGASGEPSATGPEMVLAGGLTLAFAAAAVWLAPRLPAPAWARAWLGLSAAADRLVVRPVLSLARGLAWIDDHVLDRAVEGSAPALVRLARAAARVDDTGVDRGVALLATGTRRLGALARRPQTGQIHQYYAQAVVTLTVAVVLLVLLVR